MNEQIPVNKTICSLFPTDIERFPLRFNIRVTNKILLSDKSKVLLADIENISKGLSHE